jgi:uncharacterized membrane protein HdeD (DUF308 family)
MAATFGGLILAIIMIRISRPKLYVDWILIGIAYLRLGLMLMRDPLLSSRTLFAFFYVLLAASALLTLWIGATLAAGVNGASWLVAAGLTNLFCSAMAVFSHFLTFIPLPDTILAVDLLLLGIAIAGVGISLDRSALR